MKYCQFFDWKVLKGAIHIDDNKSLATLNQRFIIRDYIILKLNVQGKL